MGSKYYVLKACLYPSLNMNKGDQHIWNGALIHFLNVESNHMSNIYANEIDFNIQVR